MTGDCGGWGPVIGGERGLEKGLGLKWSKCATRVYVGEGAVPQGKGCNKPGGRGGIEFLLRAVFVETLQLEVTCATELTEMFDSAGLEL